MVFTEVKTHTVDHRLDNPLFQIDEKKSNRIMNAVQHYMDTNKLDGEFRFDLGEVILSKGKPEIKIKEEALLVY